MAPRPAIRAQRFGAPLPDGGTIGIAAPASPYHNRSEMLRGVEWWESHGYRVKLAPGVDGRDRYVAGTARDRARDLTTLFTDPEVDVVQCLKGGWGSAELIPLLDFEAIAARPKPFVGYSDITALHIALRQRSGLATIYGPGLLDLGDPGRGSFTKDRLLAVLRSGGAGGVPADPDDPYLRPIAPGRATATLVGGCLFLLLQSLRTPYEFDPAGSILFFEDIDLPPWYLDGILLQFEHAGVLASLAGIVVGQMERCDWRETRPEWPSTKSLEDVLEERLGSLGIPVLYNLPLGHKKHLAAIPLGVMATLDTAVPALTIDEPVVRA